mmetsp:Transcript_49369/g.82058  ORF Transcript_49369/g.82058 Transcript_49369/m.82058 type:complete len:268 (+) Transcript_49369:798-1601(+)
MLRSPRFASLASMMPDSALCRISSRLSFKAFRDASDLSASAFWAVSSLIVCCLSAIWILRSSTESASICRKYWISSSNTSSFDCMGMWKPTLLWPREPRDLFGARDPRISWRPVAASEEEAAGAERLVAGAEDAAGGKDAAPRGLAPLEEPSPTRTSHSAKSIRFTMRGTLQPCVAGMLDKNLTRSELSLLFKTMRKPPSSELASPSDSPPETPNSQSSSAARCASCRLAGLFGCALLLAPAPAASPAPAEVPALLACACAASRSAK